MIGPDTAGTVDDAGRWQREAAIPAALATGVFSRATPFRNLRPEEARFPRKLQECSHLTVYEIDGEVAASLPAGIRSCLPSRGGGARAVNRFTFRRYPRPNQGRLTGNPTRGIFLILISPTERRRAQELRDWADFVHIHYIAAATPEGFTTITPYENAEATDPLFLHFYELDTADPVAAVDAMTPAVCRHRGFDLGDDSFRRWAITDSLDIWYVNVFGRVS
ncbi:MAG: hypothetical protein ACREQY_17220, partial [Candidatus Binatia bacterium]